MKVGRRGNAKDGVPQNKTCRLLHSGSVDGPETYKYNTDLNGPEACRSKWAGNIQIGGRPS